MSTSPSTYAEKLAAWNKARFAPPPEGPLTPRIPDLTTMVTMRDGVKLYTEIFLPDTARERPVPVVLLRSPYPYNRPSRHDNLPISRYLDAGFAYVFQLCRGQGRSEGEFHFMQDEGEDGFDCIGWIEHQPWCDGNIGMQGGSYSGHAQLYAARLKPPALKCIMPTGFIGNFLSSFPYLGGIPLRGMLMQWLTVVDAESLENLDAPYGDMRVLEHDAWGPALRHRPIIDAADKILKGDKRKIWREILSHSIEDEYWRPLHFSDEDIASLDLPIFITDGWHDMTIGPIAFFKRLECLRPKREQHLLIGPWNHVQTYSAHRHNLDNGLRVMPPTAPQDFVGLRLSYFRRHLMQDKKSIIPDKRVRYFVSGLDEWQMADSFPPRNVRKFVLYLHSDGNAHGFPGGGRLDNKPPEEEPPDYYLYDPNNPSHYEPATFNDCRPLEVRVDVLTYSTPPLAEPLTVLGEMRLLLHAVTDGLDTDWFALVTEVYPDGRSIPFHGAIGAMRARYRNGMDRNVPVTSDRPELYDIALGPAGHQISAGNRLRLSIFSAAFPTFDLNTNTGADFSDDTEMRSARQTVLHDVVYSSHLLLPVDSEPRFHEGA